MNAQPPQPAARDDSAVRAAPPRPRPLVLPALAFMAGIILSELVGLRSVLIHNATLILSIIALVVLGILATRRKGRLYPAYALVLVAALGFGYTRHQYELRLPTTHVAYVLTNEPVLTRVVGRIITQPTMTPAEKRNPFLPTEPSARTRFVLAATELRTSGPPTPITGFISVSVEAQDLEAGMGDTVAVTGKLYRPFGPRNPGETDWAAWSRSQSIHAALTVEGAVHVRRIDGTGWTTHGLIGSLRARAQSMLFEPFTHCESDQAQRLLDAMVLGHRSRVGRQLNEAFRRTGTSHFLAVSGFHVGVLIGLAWLITRRVLRRSARCAALATIAVIALYMLIAEQNAPILRAGTMGVLACVAVLCGRPLLSMNWLAMASLCVLAFSPLQLFRPGFQLSFILTAALFVLVPPAYRWILFRGRQPDVPRDADSWPALVARWAWRWFVGLAIANLCLWLNSVPLKLHHFGYFGPWSPVQSIIILPVVVTTIALGFLSLLTMAILPPLGALFGALLRGSTDLLLWLVDRLALLPGTFIETRRLPGGIVVLTYFVVLLFLWHLHTRGKPTADRRMPLLHSVRMAFLGTSGTAAALAWIAWLVLPYVDTRRDFAVHALSVGSGSAVLATTPDRQTLLYDVGTMHNFDAGETVIRAACALGIRRLDAVVISHANYDHYSGAPTVLKHSPAAQLRVNQYLEPAAADSPAVRRLLEMLPPTSRPAATLRAGDRFTLGDASFEVLWPPDDLDDNWRPNDCSIVLRIEAHGGSVLLPADIERDALRALLKLHEAGQIDLRSDVLIAPHHGSVLPRDTAAFYEAVEPQVVVNSSGRPRPKLTQMLHTMYGDGVRLLSTDDCGAITVRITPAGRIEVETPFAAQPSRTRD